MPNVRCNLQIPSGYGVLPAGTKKLKGDLYWAPSLDRWEYTEDHDKPAPCGVVSEGSLYVRRQ